MSLFSSAIFQEDKEPSNKFDFFDEESNNFNPLDNSFSLMSEENKLKNPIDLFESQSQLVNSKNNSDIDKECSPAPAPLRSSQSQIQTDLGASHNMECPEVVQETEGAINNDLIEIFPFKDNEEDLVEKPFDQNVYYLYTQQNLENSSNIDSNNNSDLGDKSAAVNVINNNESMNSLLFKVTNLDINNSNNNNYPAPKHNFEQAQTPLCAKNYKFNISTQNKKGNTLLFLKDTETKKNRNNIYRKLKPDSLRKKIKARLHKKLTKIINEKLKTAGSKCFFDMLPQSFITNINIGFNKPLLNITMRELFQKTFGFKSKDKEKIDYNIRIMKYIEDNPDINNNSDVSDFLDSKYSEIIREYLDGDYLQEDIDRLRDENEGEEYINRYNFIALHWIEFYENGHI
mgnify:CR=1 FL=1